MNKASSLVDVNARRTMRHGAALLYAEPLVYA